jgi:hypothetical protein
VAAVKPLNQSFRSLLSPRSLLASIASGGLLFSVVFAMIGQSPAAAQTSTKRPEVESAKQFGFLSGVAQVTVTSPKPVSGVLKYSNYSSGGTLISMPLELPTGGTKSVWVPLGNVNQFSGGTFEWDVPGNRDPSNQLAYANNGTVGPSLAVLPSALGSRQAPSSVSAPARGGTLGVATLTLDDIEQRSWILGGFAMLATTAKELNALTDEGRRAVFAWVNRGGELLIDDTEPVPLITTQPTETRNALVGAGVVRRTSNAIRTGRWEAAVLPALGEVAISGEYDRVPISIRNAVRFAPIGALLAGLTMYAAALGPVVYRFGKKRNRPMLLWTAVPLTAVITTVAVVGLGTTLRRTAKDQYMLFTVHGVVDQTTVLRAVTEHSPARSVKLPNGWLATGDKLTLEVGSGLTSSVNLRPGQVKEVRFTGPTKASTVPFEVTLVAGELTIRNLSTKKLTNIMVFGQDPAYSSLVTGQPNTEMARQLINDIAAKGETSEVYAPVSYPTYSFAADADEQDQIAVASLLQSAGLFDSGLVVVVAETNSAPNAEVPARFTAGARLLRHFHTVIVDYRETGRNAVTFNPTIRRFEVGTGAISEYVIDGVRGNDSFWVNGTQTPAEFGRTTEQQLTNGALLSESESIQVERSAPAPTATAGTDGTEEFVE